MEPITPPNKMRQIALLLSGSFFFTTSFLAFHLFQTVERLQEKPTLEAALKKDSVLLFAAIGLSALVASFFVPRFFTTRERTAEEMMRGPDPEWLKARNGKRFTAFLISMALADSVSVLGFTIGLGANNFEIACPFFVSALVAMAYHLARIQDV